MYPYQVIEINNKKGFARQVVKRSRTLARCNCQKGLCESEAEVVS